jgi:DeoR/GlpR family transcriptional regulator of sugar metabolism
VQRQDAIAEIVLTVGSATAQDLAQQFGVSVMTVHRDLDELEHRGVLRKSRGMATAQPSGVFESSVAYRLKANVPLKKEVARQAMTHVEPGMSVLFDDSTTVLQMIPYLSERAPLRVATNFLEATRQLAATRGVRLMTLGGDYDARHDAFLGVMCLQAIESIRVDATFISTSALAGAYAYHQEERVVTFKRAMLEAATQRFLLMDHTKVGKVALHRLVPLSEFDAVIIDSGAPSCLLEALRQNAVKVEVAPPGPSTTAGLGGPMPKP